MAPFIFIMINIISEKWNENPLFLMSNRDDQSYVYNKLDSSQQMHKLILYIFFISKNKSVNWPNI